jgi:hypothetical protein
MGQEKSVILRAVNYEPMLHLKVNQQLGQSKKRNNKTIETARILKRRL